MASRLKFRIIFFVIFCLPGLAAIGYSMKLATNALTLSRSGVMETGVVVGYERQENLMRVGRRFCAVVEFPHGGTTHRFTDDWCNRSQEKHPAASSVKVVFSADNPSAARIDEFGALYGKSLMIGAICSPWLLLGIALIVRVRR